MKKLKIICLALVLIGINVAATTSENALENPPQTCGPITILKVVPSICSTDMQPFTTNAGYASYNWVIYNGATAVSFFSTSTNTIYLDYLNLCGNTSISVQAVCSANVFSNTIQKPFNICWQVCSL